MKVVKAILGVILPWIKSKKAQTFVIGLLAQWGVRKLGLDEATAGEISKQVWILTLGLIVGFAAQDIGSKGKTSANYNGGDS